MKPVQNSEKVQKINSLNQFQINNYSLPQIVHQLLLKSQPQSKLKMILKNQDTELNTFFQLLQFVKMIVHMSLVIQHKPQLLLVLIIPKEQNKFQLILITKILMLQETHKKKIFLLILLELHVKLLQLLIVKFNVIYHNQTLTNKLLKVLFKVFNHQLLNQKKVVYSI